MPTTATAKAVAYPIEALRIAPSLEVVDLPLVAEAELPDPVEVGELLSDAVVEG